MTLLRFDGPPSIHELSSQYDNRTVLPSPTLKRILDRVVADQLSREPPLPQPDYTEAILKYHPTLRPYLQ